MNLFVFLLLLTIENIDCNIMTLILPLVQNLCMKVGDISNFMVIKSGPVFTKILRIFLRITLESKKNSKLRIFLFLK